MNFLLSPRSFATFALLTVGATLGGCPRVSGQAMVTITSETTGTPVTAAMANATIIDFSDINPSAFYGTGGTAANPVNSYTTPATLANTALNGMATFTTITLTTTSGTTTTPGSFVSGNASGQYAEPFNGSGTYLAVGGSRSASVILQFAHSNINYFGLFWPTPDNYNSVKLTFKDGSTAIYTPGTVNGSFNLGTGTPNSAYVTFASTNPANAITQVTLTSSSAAFETDNLAYGVVPEPSTFLCTGLLFAGGVALVIRRRSARRA